MYVQICSYENISYLFHIIRIVFAVLSIYDIVKGPLPSAIRKHPLAIRMRETKDYISIQSTEYFYPLTGSEGQRTPYFVF
jgi:hypothetical protein